MGFVVGTQTGHLVHITEARVRINPRMQGATLYRVRDGVPQIITSMSGAAQGSGDQELSSAFDLGQLV
jgi:hypothetical protein